MDTAGELVQLAADGDERAWHELVDRYTGLLWSIARSYGLPQADAADVVQTAWLRLVERLASIRDPERVGAWLATTVRRECLRALRRSSRVVLADDDEPLEVRDPGPSLDSRLIMSERDAVLWQSVDRLAERCRQLLRILMNDPPPDYEEVSAALDMPIGSIGPTRRRCLEQLRRGVQAAGLHADAGEVD